MAITAAFQSGSPNRLTFLLTQDGAAGGTLIITSAVMLATALPRGPLRDLLTSGPLGVGYANTAAVVAQFGGGNVALVLTPRANTGAGAIMWSVEPDTDAVTVTRPEMNITGPAAASTCFFSLVNVHSMIQ